MKKSRLLLGTLLTVALVTGGALAPANAATSQPKELYLFGPSMHVTTSTGHHVNLGIEVIQDQFAGDRTTTLYVDGYRSLRNPKGGFEDHNWSFDAANSDFTYDTSAGQGSVESGTDMGSFGHVDLTLSAYGAAHTQSCDPAEKDVSRHVHVSGSITFETHSRGPQAWGKMVASSGPTAFAGSAVVEADYGNINKSCIAQYNPCLHNMEWVSPGTADGLLTGEEGRYRGHRYAYVEWEQATTQYAAVGYSNRSDFSFRRVPLLHITRTHKQIRVAIRPHGRNGVSGSAVLTATGKPQMKNLKCGSHGEKLHIWKHARYQNGQKPLRVHNEIFGDARSRNSRDGGFIVFAGVWPPKPK